MDWVQIVSVSACLFALIRTISSIVKKENVVLNIVGACILFSVTSFILIGFYLT